MPKLTWTWIATADAPELAERADRALHALITSGQGTWTGLEDLAEPPPVSRSQLQKLMESGAVTVDGIRLPASARLRAGSAVTIEVPAPRTMELVPEDRPLDILFQDEHLLVVNKPPGLTVHPSTTQSEGTLVHALLHHIKDLSGIGGVLRPGIVHRIDKDTSGALVITKTDLAHQRLVETFQKHAIERAYWALCYGSPDLARSGRQERIESLIGRSPTDRKRMSMKVTEGRKAVTYVKQLEEYATAGGKTFASWLEARLETGRTHQVRVHLTGMGHSLLGDPVYGTPTDSQPKWKALPADVREAVRALPGQALHARVLGFEHPVTGRKLRFEAEPPPEFARVQAALARYR
jgi:23S rRNA pseudouridine1911/1915/1917 synthase